MIIVDDGSEDNTQTVIGQYRDSRIRYLKINHSGIFGFVRNQGIKIARGEFIAFLDSDDLWRHDKLEIQLVLLNTHANIQLRPFHWKGWIRLLQAFWKELSTI